METLLRKYYVKCFHNNVSLLALLSNICCENKMFQKVHKHFCNKCCVFTNEERFKETMPVFAIMFPQHDSSFAEAFKHLPDNTTCEMV